MRNRQIHNDTGIPIIDIGMDKDTVRKCSRQAKKLGQSSSLQPRRKNTRQACAPSTPTGHS